MSVSASKAREHEQWAAELRRDYLGQVETDDIGETKPEKKARKGRARSGFLTASRISITERAVFFRQLSISVGAGVSLRESLESVADDLENVAFKRAVQDITKRLYDGNTFSEAISHHSSIFAPLFVALLRAAEESGTLPNTLEQIANSLEKSERLRRKVQSITAYPVFVSIFFFIVCVVMTIFVLPKFQDIFTQFDTGLPPLTLFVFGLNEFLIHNALFIFGTIGGLIIALMVYGKTEKGKKSLDRFKLRMPFFGDWTKKFAVARFTRNLAMMLRGGVPVASAIEIASATAGNKTVQESLLGVRERIVNGEDMSSSLEKDPMFPRLVVRMVSVGESSGRLPDVLDRVAETYEEQVENSIMVATALFEPVVICFFGVVVLTLVLAIYMPVFTVASKAGG